MILAGDLGGTNCRLAIFDDDLKIVAKNIYKSREYESFKSIILDFLSNYKYPLKRACFGLPGPVKKGVCIVTNLPWEKIDENQLSQAIGVKVTLLNDVQANAYGLNTLKEKELVTINQGIKVKDGNRAVISPGTGLGEASVIKRDDHFYGLPSEGGHTDFAAVNDLQMNLVRYLQKEHHKISYEMLLGGRGLVRIYNFLIDSGYGISPEWLKIELKQKDQAAVISQVGLENKCPVCVKVLEIYVSILASESANVALKFFATGGVYLGGGIPPRIVAKLTEPLFRENFIDKDQMTELLETIPVYVILNDQTSLQGAAWYAINN